jgi:hypothetical protein
MYANAPPTGAELAMKDTLWKKFILTFSKQSAPPYSVPVIGIEQLIKICRSSDIVPPSTWI